MTYNEYIADLIKKKLHMSESPLAIKVSSNCVDQNFPIHFRHEEDISEMLKEIMKLNLSVYLAYTTHIELIED